MHNILSITPTRFHGNAKHILLMYIELGNPSLTGKIPVHNKTIPFTMSFKIFFFLNSTRQLNSK